MIGGLNPADLIQKGMQVGEAALGGAGNVLGGLSQGQNGGASIFNTLQKVADPLGVADMGKNVISSVLGGGQQGAGANPLDMLKQGANPLGGIASSLLQGGPGGEEAQELLKKLGQGALGALGGGIDA